MNPEVKQVITEAVIKYLNEAKRWTEPNPQKKTNVSFGEPEKQDVPIEIHHTEPKPSLSPWINKKKVKKIKDYYPKMDTGSPPSQFQTNPPGLNEKQLFEVEEIRKELEKSLAD